MVLVDTSVWLRFLANRVPYAAELDRLLVTGDAAGHELVQGELLIGDPGGRRRFLQAYDLIYRVPAVAHAEVAEFVRFHGLHGRGIGWIDAHLLASALAAGVALWTADRPLSRLAGELGVGYPMPRL